MAVLKNKFTLALVVMLASLSFLFHTPSSTKTTTAAQGNKLQPLATVIEKEEITTPYVYKDSNPYLSQALSEYDSFITRAIENGLAPGAAVVIIKDTSIVYLKGFGLKDTRTKEPVDIHSVFRIGSVSKCFASVLTGVLVEDHKLSWDDPVQRYLPDFKLKTDEHTQNLTIRHVLSHTIGLPYHAFTDRVDDGANFDTLLYHLRDVDLIGKPGQFYSYQNVGYSLIGKVIESATSKSYEENMKERVFSPLHMQTASVNFKDIVNNDNVAKPHRYGKNWTPMAISDTYYNVAPAGGINASISDMAKWLIAITDDSAQWMKNETLEELFNPAIRATARNHNFWRWKRPKSAYYAMGWRVLNFKEDTLVYHGGYVNGYRSEVAIHRKNKIAICVLVNAPGNLADISIPKFFELYSRQRDAITKWEKVKVESLARK
jgi:beta-lactamase class C